MISLKESIISSNKAGFLYSSKFNEVLLDKFFDAFGDKIITKNARRFEYKLNGGREEIYMDWKEPRASENGTSRGYITKEEWKRVSDQFKARLDKFSEELDNLKILSSCYQNSNARGNYSYVVRFKDTPNKWKSKEFEIKFWDDRDGYIVGIITWRNGNPFMKCFDEDELKKYEISLN